MTELEKMQRARQYMAQLAEGIDPVTWETLPADTALNNVRLARCFHYVGQVLDRVIANGGNVGGKRDTRGQFFLTVEERARLVAWSEPVPITTFVKGINEAVTDDQNRRKLSYKVVNAWLVDKGFLRTVTAISGHTCTAVSEQSASIGIFTEQRQGPGGSYTVILYPQEAQQFLLDHLDDILGGDPE